MKAPDTAFRFTPEIGQRLKTLREQAGLKQAEVAARMGRSSPCLVSRLEYGQRIRFPTLGLIADFLAACGASFKDIADLLDRPPAEGVIGDANRITLTALESNEVCRAVLV